MKMLSGLRIVPHQLAREVRDEWKVERHPTPKKRRQWRAVKHHIDRPGCYQVGDTLYMHPELVEKLRQATMPSNVKVSERSAAGAESAPLPGCAASPYDLTCCQKCGHEAPHHYSGCSEAL